MSYGLNQCQREGNHYKKHREEDPKFAKLAEGVEKTLSQLTAFYAMTPSFSGGL